MFFFYYNEDTSTSNLQSGEASSGDDATSKEVKTPQKVTTYSDERDRVSDSSSAGESMLVLNEETIGGNTSDANKLNELFISSLNEEKEEVIFLMRHTALEDGYDSDVVRHLRPLYEVNPYMTLLWLYQLYAENQTDPLVFASILDLLSSLGVRSKDMIFMTSLISTGLNSSYSIVQEAALKLAGKWRTADCLIAMRQAHYTSHWMQTYAERLITQIEKEVA